ncbi:MAG: hypothetical protein KGI54_10540 [Pseudomonadota bacterium]|nr:hypothetical protein [Pseudomonadota bacterium]
MTKQIEAMKQAADLLVAHGSIRGENAKNVYNNLCAAIREMDAWGRQKPVAWLTETEDGDEQLFFHRADAVRVSVGPIYPLYF